MQNLIGVVPSTVWGYGLGARQGCGRTKAPAPEKCALRAASIRHWDRNSTTTDLVRKSGRRASGGLGMGKEVAARRVVEPCRP